MPAQAKRKRIHALQIVRVLAFLAVYLCHATRSTGHKEFIFRLLYLPTGPWGVSVFLVLSGFVMMYAYWDRPLNKSFKDSFTFACIKLKPLYPLHLVMLLVGFIHHLIFGKPLNDLLISLGLNIFLLPAWIPIPFLILNSVSWYLSVSFLAYLVFPYVYDWIKRCDVKKALMMIIGLVCLQVLIGYVFSTLSVEIKRIVYFHPLYRLFDFLIGMLLAVIYMKKDHASLNGYLASFLEITAIIVNIAVMNAYLHVPSFISWMKYSSLFILTSAVLIYVFALERGILSRLLSIPLIFKVADLSAYAFLIHRLVVYIFYDSLILYLPGDPWRTAILLIGPLVISLVLSSIWQKLTTRTGH